MITVVEVVLSSFPTQIVHVYADKDCIRIMVTFILASWMGNHLSMEDEENQFFKY